VVLRTLEDVIIMAHKTYRYPKFQKAINLTFFVASIFVLVVLWVSLAIGLLGINNRTVSDASAVPASILLGFMFILLGLYVNMLTPDIRVQIDSFQLKTIFYQSQWVRWEDIRFIKKHWQSGARFTMCGVGLANIHPIYSVVGFTQLMGEPCFLLTSKIQGYKELMQLLETNRPDLFQK